MFKLNPETPDLSKNSLIRIRTSTISGLPYLACNFFRVCSMVTPRNVALSTKLSIAVGSILATGS
jgi:hypothetical protein